VIFVNIVTAQCKITGDIQFCVILTFPSVRASKQDSCNFSLHHPSQTSIHWTELTLLGNIIPLCKSIINRPIHTKTQHSNLVNETNLVHAFILSVFRQFYL